MITRKIALIAALLAFAGNAHAERYLVQFKNPQAFKNAVQSMMSADASGTGMRLLGSNAKIGQALEHLQMLVIDTKDAQAVASLKKHPAIALVEKKFSIPRRSPWQPGATKSRRAARLAHSWINRGGSQP